MDYDIGLQLRQAITPKHKRRIVNSIRAEVVLGSPGANCRGAGICRVTAMHRGWKDMSPHCKRAKAMIGLMPTGRLYFSFFKKSMCDKMIAAHFADEKGFQVETPFEIPSFLRSALLPAQSSILPGVYPTMETPGKWIVFF